MPLVRGVQYAGLETKRCPMSDDACAAKVAEHLATLNPTPADGAHSTTWPALIEKHCGRFVRGKNKGRLRGWASITICTEGGWLRLGPGERNGRVVYPGTLIEVSIGDDYSGKTYLSVGGRA